MLSRRPSPVLGFAAFALALLFILSTTRSYREELNPLPFHRSQGAIGQTPVPGKGHLTPAPSTHNEIFSVSQEDGQYWPIDFGGMGIINPNIIPHPNKTNVWIVVAGKIGRKDSLAYGQWCVQVTCEASFQRGTLACIDKPELLPISATNGGNCVGDLEILNFNIGPHDARVFYGPKSPYIIWGSNSEITCFGQWMQDFRVLVDWPIPFWKGLAETGYTVGKELKRPKFGAVEKNWFIFWDAAGDMYLHHDIVPKRSFVKLDKDGTISEDLAPKVASDDERCMAAYMPPTGGLEDIHQATNSLAIVLCRRGDPECNKEAKTYIMHIYQWKSFHAWHGVYEPHVALIHQTAPFGLYGLTKKPLWIHGRGGAGHGKIPWFYDAESRRLFNQTEMVYVTSMNWKEPGLNYVGYLDDVLMLGFGIEDERSALMDVRAGDMLRDLGLCSEL